MAKDDEKKEETKSVHYPAMLQIANLMKMAITEEVAPAQVGPSIRAIVKSLPHAEQVEFLAKAREKGMRIHQLSELFLTELTLVAAGQ